MIREIKRNGKRVRFDVQVSARHPKTGERKFLRRRAATKWEANDLEFQLRKELESKLMARRSQRSKSFYQRMRATVSSIRPPQLDTTNYPS